MQKIKIIAHKSDTACVLRAYQGFRDRGKGHLFQGTGEHRPNFKGNRETKMILRNREQKKIVFQEQGN